MKLPIKVSVIIPVYNVEAFLKECLESVVKQTLQEIEIICVNDGTKDNSMDIVKEYASKDERIIIVNKENGGLSSARNAGMNIASGEYVYFLDSDDYLRLEALEQIYQIAKKDNLDNVFFSAESFFENEEVKKKNKSYITYYDRKQEYKEVYTGQELFTLMEKVSDFRPSACLQMPRRQMLEAYGIRFFEGILHEDNLFSLQNMAVSERVKCIPDKLYMRRVRDESIMTASNEIKKSVGYFVTIREFLSFIDDMEISEEFAEALIKRLRRIYGHVISMGKHLTEEEIFHAFQSQRIQDAMQYMIYFRTASELKYVEDEHKKEIQKLKKEISKLKKSNSYKIGHALVYIPGKIKQLLKNYI